MKTVKASLKWNCQVQILSSQTYWLNITMEILYSLVFRENYTYYWRFFPLK